MRISELWYLVDHLSANFTDMSAFNQILWQFGIQPQCNTTHKTARRVSAFADEPARRAA